MIRILLVSAVMLVWTCSNANAQRGYVRGPVGGNTYIYPQGTLAYQIGLNSYRSGYFVIPTTNGGFYGSSFVPAPGYGYQSNDYVQPNGYGGGGYYWNVPFYGWNYYGR